MINSIICLNEMQLQVYIKKSNEGKNFVKRLLSYENDKIKSNRYKSIASSM